VIGSGRSTQTAEGREAAKANGKHMGRKPSLTDKQAQELYQAKLDGESISALSRKYTVSRATVHRTLERMSVN
jgi:DNA invertase Pin-like site-specific DNA recombinase